MAWPGEPAGQHGMCLARRAGRIRSPAVQIRQRASMAAERGKRQEEVAAIAEAVTGLGGRGPPPAAWASGCPGEPVRLATARPDWGLTGDQIPASET